MPDQPTDEEARRNAAASAYGVDYAHGDEDDLETPDEEPDRRLPGIIALVLLIIAAILILMLRSCGSADSGTGASSKQIESVPGQHPVPGAVSVWITGDVRLDAVLSAAGVEATSRVSMGQGRWVIGVAEGEEARSVVALRKGEGVNDAGLVYTDPVPLEGEGGTGP